jgi:hypothetical protein
MPESSSTSTGLSAISERPRGDVVRLPERRLGHPEPQQEAGSPKAKLIGRLARSNAVSEPTSRYRDSHPIFAGRLQADLTVIRPRLVGALIDVIIAGDTLAPTVSAIAHAAAPGIGVTAHSEYM